ncbi:hypothetical protein ACTG16_23130 [Aeromonas sp. 23P]|uniref:hypothetical protein n=1 Tax=Aeromonas sp. 23P TaxID=3452716 RepID=UPI003F78E2EF|nr:hypothetical protein [Aeromonas veronii]
MERSQRFDSATVNAVLAGQCTQLRIPMTDKTLALLKVAASVGECHELIEGSPVEPMSLPYYISFCPKGVVGDTLWVRETWWQAGSSHQTYPEDDEYTWCGSRRIHYAADGNPPNEPNWDYPKGLKNGAFSAAEPNKVWRKRPSVHMPRWASRILLEITDIKLEPRASRDGEGNPVTPWEWVVNFKITTSDANKTEKR